MRPSRRIEDRPAGDHVAGNHAAGNHAAGDHAAGDHAAGVHDPVGAIERLTQEVEYLRVCVGAILDTLEDQHDVNGEFGVLADRLSNVERRMRRAEDEMSYRADRPALEV